MCRYIHDTDVSTHIQRFIFLIHSFIYLCTKFCFQHLQADGRDDMTGKNLKVARDSLGSHTKLAITNVMTE